MSDRYQSVDFVIHGKVQGVFFRQVASETQEWGHFSCIYYISEARLTCMSKAFTFNTAKQNDIVGWVRNTSKGTVEGTVQGKADGINQMVHFLGKVGSPLSTITRAEFKNKRELVTLEYQNFQVTNTDW